MGASERTVNRAKVRALGTVRSIGTELREARIGGALSQQRVADAAGISRARYSAIETGSAPTLRFIEAAQAAAVLGLDLVVKLYPGAGPLRDEGQAKRLSRLLGNVGPPLRDRREVPLPIRDGIQEQRAWDAVLTGNGERTAIEVEMRIRDAQALERRLTLKRRDDPPDHFLLVLADTTTNRRVLRENPGAFADLPRLRPSRVLADLAAGRHPPAGLVMI